MHNSILMAIEHGTEYLTHGIGSFLFTEVLLLGYFIE